MTTQIEQIRERLAEGAEKMCAARRERDAARAEIERLKAVPAQFRSLEAFAGWLIAHGLLDEAAYWDADGYDGGKTLERLSTALAAARKEPA